MHQASTVRAVHQHCTVDSSLMKGQERPFWYPYKRTGRFQLAIKRPVLSLTTLDDASEVATDAACRGEWRGGKMSANKTMSATYANYNESHPEHTNRNGSPKLHPKNTVNTTLDDGSEAATDAACRGEWRSGKMNARKTKSATYSNYNESQLKHSNRNGGKQFHSKNTVNTRKFHHKIPDLTEDEDLSNLPPFDEIMCVKHQYVRPTAFPKAFPKSSRPKQTSVSATLGPGLNIKSSNRSGNRKGPAINDDPTSGDDAVAKDMTVLAGEGRRRKQRLQSSIPWNWYDSQKDLFGDGARRQGRRESSATRT